MIISQEKGRGTKSKVYRNFGMARPEGYRKALRLMKLAEKYDIPILTLIDTPGAYPGLGAEERGQAEAIARNLFEMSKLKVPIINIVIGEGASGGALGIGVGDRIICFENTWYSVISPEGCASILFRDSSRAAEAADSMMVFPFASVAALITLAVPRTVEPNGPPKKIVAPCNRSARAMMSPPSSSIRAPSASSPRRCKSIGRSPKEQPPGIETRAMPRRASIGPRTQTLARIVRTM